MKNLYNSKLSRVRKPVPFQNPHKLFAMLVLSPSFFINLTLQPKLKAKFRIPNFYMCLYHFYGTKCALKIKGTVKGLLVPQFDHRRSKNKKLLELGLELGSL